jgi:hypothetical protein
VDQARAWGVPFAYVVADAGYGDNPAFLLGLNDRQVAYGERPFFPAVHRQVLLWLFQDIVLWLIATN